MEKREKPGGNRCLEGSGRCGRGVSEVCWMEEAGLSLILQGSETDKEPYWLSVLKSLMKRGFLVSGGIGRVQAGSSRP